MKKVELLAPAGNFECLKAAINNGANACYLGGKNFSARAFANNFNEEELIKAVKYAHLHNAKIYVTLNTLLTEKEFNNAIKMADFYYRNNVDALLVQDLGLFYYLKEKYPDFEMHCSTQMHVHNIEGINNAKKLGFKRVVVARESNLDFIRQACKQGIEIETFVHGAICVSYSGQCLMSSATKNRSANKGMCAQCCRLKYELYDEDNNQIDMDTDYPLSPKDMCLINDIPLLIEAGVSSFKIEGRLKSAAYVGYVTRLYRRAIDSYCDGIHYEISEDELNNLKVLFNRNFTDDYLFGRNDLFGQKTPNHLGIEIGETIKQDKDYVYIKLSKPLNQFDGIRIGEYGCICNMIYKNGLLANHGDTDEIIALKTNEKLKGKVYKTLDYKLEEKIKSTPDLKLPLDIEVSIKANENVKVILNSYEYVSEIKAQEAKNAPLNAESITNSFSKLNDTEYYLNSIEIDTDNAFLPVKVLNEIRRTSIEKYNDYVLDSFSRTVIPNTVDYVEPTYDEVCDVVIDENSNINYVINPDSRYLKTEDAIICEFGGVLKDYKAKIAYYTLNCCNSYAYEFLKRLGFKQIIVSSELDDMSIEDMKQAYKKRNDVDIKPYVLSEGNRVLMYLKANPFDKYMNNDKNYYIKDFVNRYYVKHSHGISELIEDKSDIKDSKQVFTIK